MAEKSNFETIVEWVMTQIVLHFFLGVLALSVWLGIMFYREFKKSGQGFKEYIFSIGIYYYQLITIKKKSVK